MKKRAKVSSIMSKEVHTVNLNNTLVHVKELFDKYNIRHVPVVDGKDVIGILSKTDFAKVTFNNADQNVNDEINKAIYHIVSIEQAMTKDPFVVSSDDLVQDIAKIFSEREFHALPVIENGELVGIVTTTDIIKYLLEQY